MAQLYARGRLALGQELRNESIIGTVFSSKAVKETTVGTGAELIPAVVPEIAGRASIVGFNQWVVEHDDPLATGFLVR